MAKDSDKVTPAETPKAKAAAAVAPAAPPAPHPLEAENAALKAKVAKLEAALKHAVANGLNYSMAHDALNG